ncbi:MAG: hypothetical protein ACR2PL_22395 [Dehalococcoidia bacterium]
MNEANSMAVQTLVATALLVGLSTHLAFRANLCPHPLSARGRRAQTLQRLAAVAEQSRARPSTTDPTAEETSDLGEMSHYYIPAGLRLEQARAVIEAARLSEEAEPLAESEDDRAESST